MFIILNLTRDATYGRGYMERLVMVEVKVKVWGSDVHELHLSVIPPFYWNLHVYNTKELSTTVVAIVSTFALLWDNVLSCMARSISRTEVG